MNSTSLDLSQRPELSVHGRILSAVKSAADALGIETVIVGAFARDLHTTYAHGVPMERQTEDVDVALAVASWEKFHALRDRLIGSGTFTAATQLHRLRHVEGLPVDFVPFGGVENEHRQIHWLPDGELRMDMFGFQEALASAMTLLLPNAVQLKVVSAPALVLLKIAAWQDRHHHSPRKDGQDLWLLTANYLRLGNEPRLWAEYAEWTESDTFDYEEAGARMAGRDIAQLIDVAGRRKIAAILDEQIGDDVPGALPGEMHLTQPARARALLVAARRGLMEE
jgi:predicted nucleotidyltransferase